MRIVAGLSLKNLKPRVWDPASEDYLPDLSAVMVSWSEIVQLPSARRAIADQTLRGYLRLPPDVHAYLDNGSFSFRDNDAHSQVEEYTEFVKAAAPDWFPIPRDYIPAPQMSPIEQEAAFTRTMDMNILWGSSAFVPVIHVGQRLESYIDAFHCNPQLGEAERIAIGGIVPNLLRSPKALPYGHILESIQRVRCAFQGKELHLFGVGGTATLHIARLLGMDTADSSGWRSRAARGLIQLPGTGDRSVAKLGSWRGRSLSTAEIDRLANCTCPACVEHGIDGLSRDRIAGFRNRALHNLWVLHAEAQLIDEHLQRGTYREWYKTHLDNTVYRPLIDRLVDQLDDSVRLSDQ